MPAPVAPSGAVEVEAREVLTTAPASGGRIVLAARTGGQASTVRRRWRTWERVLVRTPWLEAGDDVVAVARAHLLPMARPGDVVVLSEKAVVIASGRALPVADVEVGDLARRLAARVRPRGDSKGLSVGAKMQHVLDVVGRPRILAAVVAAALTRPLGLRGAFYVVAGDVARAVDGGRPPFDHLLVPPLAPVEARSLAEDVARRLGHPVAIADMNDRGGSIRAVSADAPPAAVLRRVLSDNPMGQRDARTPMALVRPVPRRPGRLARRLGRHRRSPDTVGVR